MATRALTIGLVLAGAAADAAALPRPAFYFLLAAVPTGAVAALVSLGELLDTSESARGEAVPRVQLGLSTLAVALLLLATAARAPALPDSKVPALGTAAVFACLGLLALQGLVGLAVRLRRGGHAWPRAAGRRSVEA